MGRTVPRWHCVERVPGAIPSQADVCVRLDSEERTVDRDVRLAGLVKTVSIAVTVAMVGCVTRCLGAAPAVLVGPVPAVIKSVLQGAMV